jgi:hypothetical protein
LLHAAPTLYEARGDFQLIVRHLEPVGVGNLQAAFEHSNFVWRMGYKFNKYNNVNIRQTTLD